MLDAKKKIQLVGKVMKMTTAGELKWDKQPPQSITETEDEERSEVFCANSGGIKFKLFRVRFVRKGDVVLDPLIPGSEVLKFPDLASISPYLRAYISSTQPKDEWITRTVLEVAGEGEADKEVLNDKESFPLLTGLYDLVRRLASDIDRRIDAFLENEGDHVQRSIG